MPKSKLSGRKGSRPGTGKPRSTARIVDDVHPAGSSSTGKRRAAAAHAAEQRPLHGHVSSRRSSGDSSSSLASAASKVLKETAEASPRDSSRTGTPRETPLDTPLETPRASSPVMYDGNVEVDVQTTQALGAEGASDAAARLASPVRTASDDGDSSDEERRRLAALPVIQDPEPSAAVLSEDERQLRKLRKKLRQIDKLAFKPHGKLSQAEEAKLHSWLETSRRIETLEAKVNAETRAAGAVVSSSMPAMDLETC